MDSIILLAMAVIAVVYASYWASRFAPVGRKDLAVGAAMLLLAAAFVAVGRDNADIADRFGLGLGSELIGAVLALALLHTDEHDRLVWRWWSWIVAAVPITLIATAPHVDGDRSDAALGLGLDVVGAVVAFVAVTGYRLGHAVHQLDRARAADEKT